MIHIPVKCRMRLGEVWICRLDLLVTIVDDEMWFDELRLFIEEYLGSGGLPHDSPEGKAFPIFADNSPSAAGTPLDIALRLVLTSVRQVLYYNMSTSSF